MSETLRPAFNLAGTLDTISGFMYTYVLVALLIGAGLYFFIRTRALPLRLFKEAVRVVTEPPHEEGEVSSFRALMVSTASRHRCRCRRRRLCLLDVGDRDPRRRLRLYRVDPRADL